MIALCFLSFSLESAVPERPLGEEQTRPDAQCSFFPLSLSFACKNKLGRKLKTSQTHGSQANTGSEAQSKRHRYTYRYYSKCHLCTHLWLKHLSYYEFVPRHEQRQILCHMLSTLRGGMLCLTTNCAGEHNVLPLPSCQWTYRVVGR